MKITPLDIKKQIFKKILRGYDQVEVETFLEMVAEEFEMLIKEKNALSDDVLKLKTQLRDYQEVEKTFKESLMNAQQNMNQSRENSKRESTLIIKEAEIKAEKILENAKSQLIEMKNELMIIKAQKDSFAKRLKHLLESQIELLKVLEIDDLGFDNLKSKPKQPAAMSNAEQRREMPARHIPEKKQDQSNDKNDLNDLKISGQFIL